MEKRDFDHLKQAAYTHVHSVIDGVRARREYKEKEKAALKDLQ